VTRDEIVEKLRAGRKALDRAVGTIRASCSVQIEEPEVPPTTITPEQVRNGESRKETRKATRDLQAAVIRLGHST